MSKLVAPYGSWRSPVTSDMVASGVIRLGQVELDGEDIYWCEIRPSEAGRYVVVRRSLEGKIRDVNPSPFNARTGVHEYGGGAYKVNEGIVYFTHFSNQCLYRIKPGIKPKRITFETELRHADFIFDTKRERIVCVREDHGETDKEVVNTIVSMDLEGEDFKIIISGNDFYSSPRISPDGLHLVWLTWNHPNMSWDGTELWMGKLSENESVEKPKMVAGGLEESVLQPMWSPGGILYFISDRSYTLL